ncbi:hypothetical protein FRC03_012631 [Tulasnella sp. 419]|nr:hypothetical protein FRC03_012631 [Tulasnella sp. 419]
MSESSHTVEKLRGAVNYRKWKEEVSALLRSKGLWSMVQGQDHGSAADGRYTQQDLAGGDANAAPNIPLPEVFKANQALLARREKAIGVLLDNMDYSIHSELDPIPTAQNPNPPALTPQQAWTRLAILY